MLHVCYFRKLPNLATRVSIYNSYIAVTLVHLICPCHPYYDVLQMICLEAFLYWLQTFDLKDHEMEWVTTHFGHTLKVHKVSYRQTSSAIERTSQAAAAAGPCHGGKICKLPPGGHWYQRFVASSSDMGRIHYTDYFYDYGLLYCGGVNLHNKVDLNHKNDEILSNIVVLPKKNKFWVTTWTTHGVSLVAMHFSGWSITLSLSHMLVWATIAFGSNEALASFPSRPPGHLLQHSGSPRFFQAFIWRMILFPLCVDAFSWSSAPSLWLFQVFSWLHCFVLWMKF